MIDFQQLILKKCFSQLERIMRFTMTQERLHPLLCISQTVNYDLVINSLALKKHRKAYAQLCLLKKLPMHARVTT